MESTGLKYLLFSVVSFDHLQKFRVRKDHRFNSHFSIACFTPDQIGVTTIIINELHLVAKNEA